MNTQKLDQIWKKSLFVNITEETYWFEEIGEKNEFQIKMMKYKNFMKLIEIFMDVTVLNEDMRKSYWIGQHIESAKTYL